MPHTRDFSDAMFRRATILKFNQQFIAGVDADPRLKTVNYWADELPGILNMALQAYGRAIELGTITDPKSSIEAKHEWLLEADQVTAFVEDCIDRLPGATVASSSLYDTFRAWANEQGVSHIVSHKAFTNRLECRGIKCRHTRDGNLYDGVLVKDVKGF